MLTRNFINHWKLWTKAISYNNGTADESATFKDASGTEATKTDQNTSAGVFGATTSAYRPPLAFSFVKSNRTTQTANFSAGVFNPTYAASGFNDIMVGSGDTEATADDYALETPITNLSYVTTGQEIGDDGYVYITKTYYNGTGSTVTIKEIGLFGTIGSAGNPYLLAREVLETPIELADGQTIKLGVAVKYSNS